MGVRVSQAGLGERVTEGPSWGRPACDGNPWKLLQVSCCHAGNHLATLSPVLLLLLLLFLKVEMETFPMTVTAARQF